ncbi:MAG: helix-turn-helix transcriptional regulator [Erysipelotrichaceae bacterium]|nr:helix-turn-helix transcriptional regulator [Erysipelotrichaceae bacterium]
MLTEVGKYIRKLRVENDELLKDMSDKLGVSVAFLSAVENGKKKVPNNWVEKLSELYSLNENEKLNLINAIAATEKSYELNFEGINRDRREIAISFARKLEGFSDDQLDEIRKILGDN